MTAIFRTDCNCVYHIEYIDDSHVRLTSKGEPMKPEKPSTILAWAGWASVFVEGWLLLLRMIPADRISVTFFVLFFFLAVMASAVYSGKPKLGAPAADIRVRIGDQIFSEQNGNLTMRRNGNVIMLSIDPKDVTALLFAEKKEKK